MEVDDHPQRHDRDHQEQQGAALEEAEGGAGVADVPQDEEITDHRHRPAERDGTDDERLRHLVEHEDRHGHGKEDQQAHRMDDAVECA